MRHLASLSACPALWRSLPCPSSELRLDFVLPGGQSFRWRESSPGFYTGVVHERVWTLTQKDDRLWYAVYPNTEEQEGKSNKETQKKATKRKLQKTTSEAINTEDIKQEKDDDWTNVPIHIDSKDCKKDGETLEDYFQLHLRLQDLYKQWGESDTNFQKIAREFSGIRILRQDPVECLFSFICTSNNHISRITGMIERVCSTLGRRLCRLDSVDYYSFPSLQALAANDTEIKLRNLGFGYRAKFVSQSARTILHKHGLDWLEGLRHVPYEEAKKALCDLPGVGAKIADCVCLMALDKPEAVPVDTHVWQIAKRDYLPQLGQGNKSITERVYREIGDYFRNLWGPYAGWAQGVLFCSDLKKFQSPDKPPKAKTKAKTKLKKENSMA
ncbi:N-glycosylase/DNA lyase [Rana temporaria]|uniref:N-glycosylase/DNA lyase n=1 Tax=Rana temporaria TaxID=8407 RepID=UPI001AAD82F1|nr:N-glycosylase/DNA lyase [Rana temporaria]XP_040214963.1 N-glycosylase/DNA lyase [Rana temporaria]